MQAGAFVSAAWRCKTPETMLRAVKSGNVVIGCAIAWLASGVGCNRDRTTTLDSADGAAAPSGTLHVVVTDPDTGLPIACKLLVTAPMAEHGRMPHLGARSLGQGNAIYGDPCDILVSLPVGTYHLQASQGIERELAVADVQVNADVLQGVPLVLPRALDTQGYACADFHVHSAPSFDSDVPLDQRLISAVCEGLDAIAPTDHEAVGDWAGEQARLEMADELTLVVGNEVTPDVWPTPQAIGHFGIFPVPRDFDPTAYELTWQSPAGLLQQLDTLYPDSLIQVNHPRWDASIGYFIAGGFDPRDPTLDQRLGLSHLDAIELWNTHQMDVVGGPSIETLLQDFYALLDLGYSLVATGNTDTHELSRHPLGYPRNCIRVPDDHHPGLTPEALIDGLAAGRVLVTSGPWLEVSLDGHGPGEMATLPDSPILKVLVDAASWVPVDRIHVIVNGREVAVVPTPSLPAELQVPLELPSAVSYIMVLAEGDAPLPSVAGALNVPQRSFAFTNPLWVQPP
jgi:hypothetical protein